MNRARALLAALALVAAGCEPDGKDEDIALAGDSVEENAPAGTLVGTFRAVPADAWLFTLVPGNGDDDNAKFTIDGNHLETAEPLDFEDAAALSVRVRASRPGDDPDVVERFTITVTDGNDAPSVGGVTPIDLVQNTLVTSALTLTFTVVDQDGGDTFTATAFADPVVVPGGSVSAQCSGVSCVATLPATVRTTAGEFALTVTATDAGGRAGSATTTITIEPLRVTNALDDGSAGTLRSKVAAAADGDVVGFDPAVFSTARTITFSSPLALPARTITLEGPSESLLALSGGDLERVVALGPGGAATIRDLTISHGRDLAGAGILVSGASLSLQRVTVRENVTTLTGFGGGMACLSGTVVLDDVTFLANAAETGGGGGLWADACGIAISRSRFEGNTSVVEGGAIYALGGELSVTRSLFRLNAGDSTLTASVPNARVEGCVFERNDGSVAAIDFAGAGAALVGSTLYGNTGFGSTIRVSAGDLQASSVIVWDAGSSIAAGGGARTFAFSDLLGSGGSGGAWDSAVGTDGGGNVDVDPLFLDGASGDFRLHELSPLIDRGQNSAVGSELDFDGNPRVLDGNGNGTATVDIGALEFAPPPQSPPAN